MLKQAKSRIILRGASRRFESKEKPYEVYFKPVQANQVNSVQLTWKKVEGNEDKSGKLSSVRFGDCLEVIMQTVNRRQTKK